MMNILLTGASGFVGSGVRRSLLQRGMPVRSVFRSETSALMSDIRGDTVELQPSLGGSTDWRTAVAEIDAVVHCAARVHVMRDTAVDPLSEFRNINTLGTMNLARQAAAAGVKRFVFVSSIKVNGEGTAPGMPFTAQQVPNPIDPYGVSKWEAEQELHALAAETGMEVVIIRPVLVYGPGVKANFLNMMKWLYEGVPLPLGAIHNKRSLVALDNLVDLIVTCIDHPQAANQTFLVSDGEDLSTTELLQRMSRAFGKRPRLLPVPVWMLEAAASLLGKKSVAQRLCGSLQVDISCTCERLGWTPPVSVDAALRKTAQHFLDQQKQ
ncbi:UDP-glucose 4-epimerase family protein [Parazoarcus communis]|uniref:UDP-glucose 4-epimerase family protein n=1 Tax=Parazoarcus communis TaxID=41977 RepID=UPI001B7D1E13|nr:SDR family oxidoreductase [Parazoarcus communis]